MNTAKEVCPMSAPLSFSYADFAFFERLRDIPTHRLCELAVIRELNAQGCQFDYDASGHDDLWARVKAECVEYGKRPHGPDIDFLCDFMTQFSPHENKTPPEHPNHISRYVKQALLVNEKVKERANIVEIGANQGIASLALNILGHNILTTNMCIDMIDCRAHQVSYRSGAWLMENFLRLDRKAHCAIAGDDFTKLCCFDSGIDAIIWRSTVDLFSRLRVKRQKNPLKRIGLKIFDKLDGKIPGVRHKNKRELTMLFNNYRYLLSFLNRGGGNMRYGMLAFH